MLTPVLDSWLLLLHVLGLGLLQDGDIRIGVFPEGEEIFVFCQLPNAGGPFFETYALLEGV